MIGNYDYQWGEAFPPALKLTKYKVTLSITASFFVNSELRDSDAN